MTAIDNSTHEDVVSGETGRQARRVLRGELVDDLPLATDALIAFFESEAAFPYSDGRPLRESSAAIEMARNCEVLALIFAQHFADGRIVNQVRFTSMPIHDGA